MKMMIHNKLTINYKYNKNYIYFILNILLNIRSKIYFIIKGYIHINT